MEVKLTIQAFTQVDSLPKDVKAAIDAGIEEIRADPTVGNEISELGPVRRLHDVQGYVIMYDLKDLVTIVAVTDSSVMEEILFG